MTDRDPVVVVVGAASRDITVDDPRGWRLGGGASYSALALARLGIRTRALIGVDALAATADELASSSGRASSSSPCRWRVGPCSSTWRRPTGASRSRARCLTRSRSRRSRAAGSGPTAGCSRRWPRSCPTRGSTIPPTTGRSWVSAGRGCSGCSGPAARSSGSSPARRRSSNAPTSSGWGRTTSNAARRSRSSPRSWARATRSCSPTARRGGTVIVTAPDGLSRTRDRWAAIPIRALVDPAGAGDTFLAGVFAARLVPSLSAARVGDDPDLRFGAACASLVSRARAWARCRSSRPSCERLDAVPA